MPNRLVGARASFWEKMRERSVVGRFTELKGDDLLVTWEEHVDPPVGGIVMVTCFANAAEYLFEGTTIGGDSKRCVIRPISDLKELPMAHSLRLLTKPLKGYACLDSWKGGITIVAVSANAFAFESNEVLPMDDSTEFGFQQEGGSVIELDADIVLQRFEGKLCKGVCEIKSFTRLAQMHWNRHLR